jgi:hypothetical protein
MLTTASSEEPSPNLPPALEPPPAPASRRPLLERLGSVPIEAWVTLVVVGACCAFTVAQLHPEYLVRNTTPAGGDMGAHVWGPAYLRDVLIPSGRLSGWSPDWYAGFPAYQFYMVIPSLLIVLLDVVLPYGISFKLVTVSGVVALPISAWAFGKLARLPFPTPPLLAAGATVFLFDRSFSIYGGNIASTLAGEFAFSMSLALAVLYLGVLARGLQTGKHRGWAAILLALCGLCHLIPAFFAVAGTLLWFVIWAFRDAIVTRKGTAYAVWLVFLVNALVVVGFGQDWPSLVRAGLVLGGPAAMLFGFFALDQLAVRRDGAGAHQYLPAATRARMVWLLTVAPVAGLLAAFWVLPFYARQRYLNDMGWVKEVRFLDYLTWRDEVVGGGLKDAPELAWALALAMVGIIIAAIFRHKAGIFLAGVVVFAGVAFIYAPQGRLWNTRLLPFYYLALYLLSAFAIGQLHQLLAHRTARRAVGLVVGFSVAVLQFLMIWNPTRLELPGYVWDPVTINDDGHFVPFLLVGIALIAAIVAAELATAPTGDRRRGAIIALGGAVLCQTVMVVEPDLRVDDRFLPYFYAFLLVAVVGAAVEVLRANYELRRRLTIAFVATGVALWLGIVLGPSAWNRATGLLPYFFAALALVVLAALLELRLSLVDPQAAPPSDRAITRVLRSATAVGGALVVLVALALPLRVEPGTESAGEYQLGPFSTSDQSFVDGWAAWNYRG